MARPKPKRKASASQRRPSPLPGKKASGSSQGKNILYAVLALVFLVGQVFVLKGYFVAGLAFSLLSLGPALLVYLGGLASSGGGPVSLLKRPVARPVPARKSKAPQKTVPHFLSAPPRISFAWTVPGLLRGLGAISALILVGVGQSYMLQQGDGSTLWKGIWFFLAASILFIASLWPWMREGLRNIPMPSSLEGALLALILVIAVFLRVYHIENIPSGLFIDQGYEGIAALRILHEGWRPFYVEDIFHAYSLALFQLALWFKIFGPGEVSLKLFYAFLGLLGLPLVYWTFRQLAGTRVALLSLFVLAVMRWNYLFSRDGFPTVQMSLYMFGTMAFLIYAVQGKRASEKPFFQKASIGAAVFFVLGVLPFAFFSFLYMLKQFHAPLAILAVVLTLAVLAGLAYMVKISKNRESLISMLIAAGFFVAGAYTYQAYKAFPLLVLLYGLYEIVTNFKMVKSLWKETAVFAGLSIVLCLPVVFNPNSREGELIVHSFRQFLEVLGRTAIMFNRQGDPNSRHNLQDYRMLDDISAALFVLGIAYSLFRVWRRKYFYVLIGFLVMCLPCVLSIDAAHANRLFALTPFIAFLVVAPLSALWGRVKRLWGTPGEWIFLVLMVPFLWGMTRQNFNVYFHQQANNQACWSEYSARETSVGRMVAKYGDAYDYFITPRSFNYFTINFLGYTQQDHLHPLNLPDALISHTKDTSRGLLYTTDESRPGIFETVKSIYPGGASDILVDTQGNTAEYFYRVPAEELAKVRGLTARFDREVGGKREEQITQFPSGLPAGPYHATLTGRLYVDSSGNYQWQAKADFPVKFKVGTGRSASLFKALIKGYYPVKVDIDVPAGAPPNLLIKQIKEKGTLGLLDAGSFDSLPPAKGLKGSFFMEPKWDGEPYSTEYDPVINYTNGNDFTSATRAVHWSGHFKVAEAGIYQFSIQTDSQSELKIDGKTLGPSGLQSQGIDLTAGVHDLDVYGWRPGSYVSEFSLYWIKPGGKREVMPNAVFTEAP